MVKKKREEKRKHSSHEECTNEREYEEGKLKGWKYKEGIHEEWGRNEEKHEECRNEKS